VDWIPITNETTIGPRFISCANEKTLPSVTSVGLIEGASSSLALLNNGTVAQNEFLLFMPVSLCNRSMYTRSQLSGQRAVLTYCPRSRNPTEREAKTQPRRGLRAICRVFFTTQIEFHFIFSHLTGQKDAPHRSTR
jgi:hypothetical protein